MSRVLISSGSPFEPQIGFSRAVRVGNWVSVSGTAPILPDGSAPPGGAGPQARRCLEIIEGALSEAGLSKTDVVRTRVYLRNACDWIAVAQVHGEVFGEIRPASTFVAVAGFIDPNWLVEIEADAMAP
ncbi:MAG: RidA family protein [Armatimonadetes bacterium]|nr:RidA family protein [Armatimonadota bacterium]